MANAETYTSQAFKVLDEARTEVVFNGDWFRNMNFEKVLRLNSRVTMQQMLQRDDFRKRIDKGQEVRLHEVQYPIVQGWDSVEVRADIELGGTDQLFNLLVGRDLQKEEGMSQQVVMTMPLLEGTDGVKKMSKSYDNYVGVSDSPGEMFGKLMSISDTLMDRYYLLLLGGRRDEELHPMEAKKQLAQRTTMHEMRLTCFLSFSSFEMEMSSLVRSDPLRRLSSLAPSSIHRYATINSASVTYELRTRDG